MQPSPPQGPPPPAMPPAYGMPPPAYGPPPGYYPPPPQVNNTREGVSYFTKALLLQLLVGLVAFVLALAAISMISSLGSGNWEAGWGSLVAIAGAAIVILLLALVFIVLALVGIYKFYKGKDEFGPVHAKNFTMAIVFFILGIIVPNAGGAFTPAYNPGTSLTDFYNSIRTSLIISGVMGIVGALFMGLGLTTLVKHFTTEEASKFRIGLILLLVGPIIGLATMLVVFPAKPGTGITGMEMVSFYSVASTGLYLGGIVSLIGYFFFYQGYKSILAKMDSGAIRPGMMPGPMAPPPYQMAPPPAYAGAPPPAYPGAPPPAYGAPPPAYGAPPPAYAGAPPPAYAGPPPPAYGAPPPAIPGPPQPPTYPAPPQAPVNCRFCGNPVPPGSTVCPRCGGRL